jgi:hypothetical protein
VLSALGAAANGFKARVTDLFYDTTTANATPVYKAAVLEWYVNKWIAGTACSFNIWHQSTHVNSSVESAALSTVVLPRWLCGAGNTWRTRMMHGAAGGTASTLTSRIKYNGSTLFNSASGSGVAASNIFEADIYCASTTAQFLQPNIAIAQGGTASTSASIQTTAIDTTANDITITTTGQVTVTDKTITHYMTRVELLP